jgi:RimJ/RimL family protein N-acetyltransferase
MDIHTERLVLRPWRKEDFEPFAELNADPRVMEYFPATLTRKESDALAARILQGIDKQGWGLWAVEVPGVAPFIGFIGLNPVTSLHNRRSQAVMKKIGMHYEGEFDHPLLTEDHPLRGAETTGRSGSSGSRRHLPRRQKVDICKGARSRIGRYKAADSALSL